MATRSNVRFCFRKSKKSGEESELNWWDLSGSLRFVLPIAASRSGDGNGSGFNNTALTTLKMAVFAPIPSARVSTATRVNPGDFRSWRKASFRSFMLLGAQSLNRVDTCSAARREQTRRQCDRREQNCCAAEQHWVVRRNLIELRRDQPAERERRNNAEREPAHHWLQSRAHDELQDIACLRPERHADADLPGSLLDSVSDCAVNPDPGETHGHSPTT